MIALFILEIIYGGIEIPDFWLDKMLTLFALIVVFCGKILLVACYPPLL